MTAAAALEQHLSAGPRLRAKRRFGGGDAGEQPPTGRWRPTARALLGLVAFKAALGAALWSSGFRAVSDDDFARLEIAQRFALHPSWDPSGTSWLPVPFWLQGGVYRCFGLESWVPMGTASLLALLTVAVLFWLGRARGGSPRQALVGAAFASALPHALWLGFASVPDGYTALLLVVAILSTSGAVGMAATNQRRRDQKKRSSRVGVQESKGLRLLGALALFGACLSRYEAWACVPPFVAYCLWDAARALRDRDGARLLELTLSAALAAAGPALWLWHGARNHGDAWFFVKRVAHYRSALGAGPEDLGRALLNYPRLLVVQEPELSALSLLVLGLWLARRLRWRHPRAQSKSPCSPVGALECRATLAGWVRPGVFAICLLGFLILGDLRGTSPTHHPERPLLSLWLLVALALGWWLAGRFRGAWVTVAAGMGIGLGLARGVISAPERFEARAAEWQIGKTAAGLVPRGERLSVWTEDYGYFAVKASFGRPDAAMPLIDADPRRARVEHAGSAATSLSQRLHEQRSRWLVLPTPRMAIAASHGTVRGGNASFSLLELP